jgi:type I restriction enzyme R subunit
MTTLDHTESAFEKLIVAEMTGSGGWEAGDPRNYDAQLGLYFTDAVGFIVDSQPKQWDKLVSLAGAEAAARASLQKRLASQLDKHGTVQVLRRGFSERGVNLSLCQLKPAHSLDEATEEAYQANRLRVVRQVRFDPKGGDSVDVVLFVNGVPTATAELKNRWTNQSVDHAIEQYRTSRDPRIVLFARRAFVHFAIDAELAYMTTRLEGQDTVFLPFNQGSGGPGRPGGKGNPGSEDGHSTSYVWREVWERDRWVELIQKFVHVEPPAEKGGRSTIVFPRYHQWHVVVECQAHAGIHGAGHNYLIQHSAGSGKTKEIAWLAHELSSLHDAEDTKVFHKVVVITDRRVLDAQLRRQLEQFEQVAGVVRSVTGSSAELREALTSDEAKIVVTTLQKFPFVLRALDEAGEGEGLGERRYAIVADEAHSSQSGEAAADLKAMLGSVTAEDLDLDEDDGTPAVLLARLAARGRQPNLSFFAFTATPKGKTLELFGERDPLDGALSAWHTYSMRQAIEEGFIVDVLRNYTTFDQLARLETAADERIEVPKGKTSSFFSQFVNLHPYVKAQKAAIVVEHFKRTVRPLLGGEGKAMVVCASREEAVQWKRALDREIERHGHDNVKALVAFSGEVTVRNPVADNAGMAYTEPEMNAIGGKPLPESRLPQEFAAPAYGVLVVAEKYQTGFDQPRLCGMYVDKVLTGVNAVQTLSRLNRSSRGKEDVYVLDFRNDSEHIRAAFEPYFGHTEGTPTDPNVLFDAGEAVLATGVVDDAELAAFRESWAELKEIDEDRRHAVLSTSTQGAYERALALERDERRELRDALERFVRFYGFLAQVLSYVPAETEVLFQFSKVLLKRLLAIAPSGGVNLAGSVALTHFRLDELGADRIELKEEEAKPVSAITGDGRGGAGPGQIPLGPLGELVEVFNERYGEALGSADALRVVEEVRDVVEADNAALQAQARANSREDFVRHRDDLLIGAALTVSGERDKQATLLKAMLDDEDFRERAGDLIMGSIWDEHRGEPAG